MDRVRFAYHRTWREVTARQGFVTGAALAAVTSIASWKITSEGTATGLLRVLAIIGASSVVLVLFFLAKFVWHVARGAPILIPKLEIRATRVASTGGWVAGITQGERTIRLSIQAPPAMDRKQMPPLECIVTDKYGDAHVKEQPAEPAVGYGDPIRTAYDFAFPADFDTSVEAGKYDLRWCAMPGRETLVDGSFRLTMEEVGR